MACDDAVFTKLKRFVQKAAEFYMLIAIDAWVWRTAFAVGSDKSFYDPFGEAGGKIKNFIWYLEVFGGGPRIRFAVFHAGMKLHCRAHAVKAVAQCKHRSNRAVNTPAHSY
jgi:hypothetical protein